MEFQLSQLRTSFNDSAACANFTAVLGWLIVIPTSGFALYQNWNHISPYASTVFWVMYFAALVIVGLWVTRDQLLGVFELIVVVIVVMLFTLRHGNLQWLKQTLISTAGFVAGFDFLGLTNKFGIYLRKIVSYCSKLLVIVLLAMSPVGWLVLAGILWYNRDKIMLRFVPLLSGRLNTTSCNVWAFPVSFTSLVLFYIMVSLQLSGCVGCGVGSIVAGYMILFL